MAKARSKAKTKSKAKATKFDRVKGHRRKDGTEVGGYLRCKRNRH
jgi:hypothetical protein